MRAVTVDAFDAVPAVRDDLADPSAAADGLVVRVHASSVNPVDNAIAAGMLREMVEHDFPVILGRDYAGTVEAIGADVDGYAEGDEVFGFILHANPTVHEGSWAELIALTPEMQVAPKPTSLDLAAAGVAPLAGIAALAAVDALALSKGMTILIVGATGGVGSFAVQLAARAGATIIAPALREDGDYLRDLGVGEQLDRDGDVSPPSAKATPTASTHCSISSPTRRERSTARSRTVHASPRRTAQPEKGRPAPTRARCRATTISAA